MTCKDCIYYEVLPNEHFYCEKHNDIFCNLVEDDNWCPQFKPFNKEEQKNDNCDTFEVYESLNEYLKEKLI